MPVIGGRLSNTERPSRLSTARVGPRGRRVQGWRAPDNPPGPIPPRHAMTSHPIAAPSPTSAPAPLRLTSFSHGGGCGCKIAPGVLSQILRSGGGAGGLIPPELMVGIETADDAAVYRLNERQALVATTDFFMPIVDDPYEFGRIAATNALSDVYAMGARPIMALALVAMPVDRLPVEVIGEIVRGGQDVCRAAGIPVAGGHTIDSVEPIYGLVALGLVHPGRVRRNADAQAGDVLVLGKPLGVGVLSAALKKERLPVAGYRQLIDTATRLNTPGMALAELEGVHALTDVTGFGLAGHALELSRGAGLAAVVEWHRVPLLDGVAQLAADGCVTGASGRNWAGYGAEVRLADGLPATSQSLLSDPQTSGGLLVSCAAEAVETVLGIFRAEGFGRAAVIGRMEAGPAGLRVIR